MSPTRATVGHAAEGDAERRRHDAVDAVGAPVGVGPRRRAAEPLEVADRHRRGDDELGVGREVAGDRPGDGRLAERRLRAEHVVDGRLGQRARRRASDRATPGRRHRRAARRAPAASPASRRATTPWSGSTTPGPPTCTSGGTGRGDPLGEDLRRRRAADAHDDVGPQLGGQPVVAQEGVERRRRRRRAIAGRDVGSASTGQPVAATNGSTTSRRGRPSTAERGSTPRPWSSSGSRCRRLQAAGDGVGLAARRGAAAAAPGRPTSGSRNGRLRCTGPVRAARERPGGRASATSPTSPRRRRRDRGTSARRGRTGGSGRSSAAAPTSRSSGGRSAVTTSIGTSDSPASTTAGWRLAAAVPLVHSSTAGVPPSPSPRATNAGDPLVVDDVHGDVRPRRQRQRHRRAARAGRDDGVADAVGDELVDERGAERRLDVAAIHGQDDTGRRRAVGWAPVLVEVWSDVVCPWCYIGKRRFAAAVGDARRRPGRSTPTIEVVYRPFQLDPNAPPGTTMPVAEAYARKFGGPEQAAAIIDNITAIAAAEGLEFHLDRAQRANTRDAHRLLWYAATSGPPGRPGRAQGAAARRLLRRRPQRRRPRRARRGGGRGRPRRRRRPASSSTATPATPRSPRRWRTPPRPGSPPSRRTSSTAGGRSPAPRTRPCSSRCCSAWPRRNVPADDLAVTRRGAGPPLVLVHGFTQTGRSWDPIADRLADAPRGRRRRRARPRRFGRRARRPARRRRAARSGRRPGDVRRLLDGRPAVPAPRRRPARTSSSGSCSSAPRPASTTPASGPRGGRATSELAATIERDGVDAFLDRWVAQPLFATLAEPGLDDRRRNTADGLASSLRLAGTGTQEPLWDALPALTMPVLLVAGALDAKFVAVAERMAGLLPRRHAGDRRRRRPHRPPRAARRLPRRRSTPGSPLTADGRGPVSAEDEADRGEGAEGQLQAAGAAEHGGSAPGRGRRRARRGPAARRAAPRPAPAGPTAA